MSFSCETLSFNLYLKGTSWKKEPHMKNSSRILVLTLLFIAAAASYVIGSAAGTLSFLLLGVTFELAFWIKLVGKSN